MKNYWVDYKGGIINQPKKARGILTFQEQQLDFKSEKSNFTIPIKSIVDVRVRNETDSGDVIAGALALGIVGAILGNRSKIGVMTISYQDATSDPQYPEFSFVTIVRHGIEVKSVDLITEAAKQLYELRLESKKNRDLGEK